jgi:hypothetical protein
MCNAAVHVQGLSNTAALIYQSEKKKKKKKKAQNGYAIFPCRRVRTVRYVTCLFTLGRRTFVSFAEGDFN